LRVRPARPDPVPSALLPVHRTVGRGRCVVRGQEGRPGLGGVGRLRDGRPECVAGLRDRPRRVLRLRLRDGIGAHPAVPQRYSGQAGHGRGRHPVLAAVRGGTLMRLPYSWLREVVRAGAPDWDVSPDELEDTLINIGHEVEEVIPVGPVSGPLTVGRVLDIEELTEFKKPIRAVKVDVGEPEPRDIICGATNFKVSDLVVVALPGTVLPGDFTITSRKTYGRISDGMICSAAELNLGVDHSGILVLPPGTAEPGAGAADVLGLDDVVFHLAITPDRGYCLSVRGLAREIACAHDLDFVDPADVPPLPAEGEAWPSTVQPGT